MLEQTLVLDLSKYIERQFFDNRPHIRGRRIPIATIAYTARDNHHGITELMHDFNLSESEVLAALLYYAEHKEEIDTQQAAEKALFDEAYRAQHGSD